MIKLTDRELRKGIMNVRAKLHYAWHRFLYYVCYFTGTTWPDWRKGDKEL
jgi:hypothetical protein